MTHSGQRRSTNSHRSPSRGQARPSHWSHAPTPRESWPRRRQPRSKIRTRPSRAYWGPAARQYAVAPPRSAIRGFTFTDHPTLSTANLVIYRMLLSVLKAPSASVVMSSVHNVSPVPALHIDDRLKAHPDVLIIPSGLDGEVRVHNRRFRQSFLLNPSVARIMKLIATRGPYRTSGHYRKPTTSVVRYFIELTSRCNLRCRHCYGVKGPWGYR